MFESSTNYPLEWEQLCTDLSGQHVLSVFDATNATKISCDASQNGIGAALLQCNNETWQPVAYASRVLTEPEQRYSQIEKVAMACVHVFERFHHFVYGRKVIVETDHHPLPASAFAAYRTTP